MRSPFGFAPPARPDAHFPLHIDLIALGGIGVDQPIVTRLANDQALHQRAHKDHSFPKWVPKEVLGVGQKLTEDEAASQLAFLP
jgi:hypothetical protein